LRIGLGFRGVSPPRDQLYLYSHQQVTIHV
jgi:hypothetical protein